ncbi:MAG: cell division protein FtsW [Candidatus Marinimicrobia bacterium]|jgi:cell division protein FtsW|nr:cell division protein FtsW [Pelagibacterales bacterium]MBL6911506.1 cell division protein FtsW [Candidatus Neomarinimicrobiota bacterium]MBT3728393.1 cell division protein FtsW [Candidatus Neomarinimicrobiota bacterium]MBT3944033.1 cell division protein FtsW [Candidatus Neomarinimicrobiota bacterium]MBT4111757.1 cell division protein FtsW [Candidatus Neomarinimicrobiota bacterium]
MNIKERKQDRWLLGTVIVLVIFGLSILFSASWIKSLEVTDGVSRMYFLKNQLFKFIPGLFVFFVASHLNYRKLQYLSPVLMIGSFLLLIYTQVQGCNGDSCRWLSIGPISFQTSDLARFSVILFLADYIDRNYKYMNQFVKGILIPLCWILPICLMIIIQPDNSTTLILLSIVFILLFIGGVSLPQIGTVGVLSVGAIGIFILNSKNYALGRILSFLDPSSSASVGYQSSQALIGLRQGGISGMGIGESIQKHSYLPETHTDFIFAIIGEELGFIAGFIVMMAYGIILFRAIQISKKSNDIFGIILSIGFGLSITFYALINIGVVIGIIPVTGVPLPFVSYGGSSLIINLLMVAILLNISKAQRKFKVKKWRLRVDG